MISEEINAVSTVISLNVQHLLIRHFQSRYMVELARFYCKENKAKALAISFNKIEGGPQDVNAGKSLLEHKV